MGWQTKYNHYVQFSAIRRLMGMTLIIASLFALYWGGRAFESKTHTLDLSWAELQPAGTSPTGSTSLETAGRLRLEWPSTTRLGDPAEIRLRFDAAGELKPALSSQRLILSARLDLPQVQHTPTGEVNQGLSFDHPVFLLWNLRSNQNGMYQGRIWVYLRNGSDEAADDTPRLLAVIPFDIEVESGWGLSGSQARLAGSLGLVIGLFLEMDCVLAGFGRLRSGFNKGHSQS